MKKTILSIAIGLVGMTTYAQTQDPVIVGARKHLKYSLKNPSSYIEYSSKKYSYKLSDAIKDSVSEYESKITTINSDIRFDSTYHIKDNADKLIKLRNDLIVERVNFINTLEKKTSELKTKYEFEKQYADTSKFIVSYNEIKSNVLKELTEDITPTKNSYGSWNYSSYASMLEDAKEKGDLDRIKQYTDLLAKAKHDLGNIDSVVKKNYKYGDLSFVKYQKNRDEYFKLLGVLNLIKGDSSKIDSVILDFEKNSYIGTHISSKMSFSYYKVKDLLGNSYGSIKYYENDIIVRKRSIESKKIQLAEYDKKLVEFNKTLISLTKTPSLNKTLYYYVVFDYSGTNSYGGRVRDKEVVNYSSGEYWID